MEQPVLVLVLVLALALVAPLVRDARAADKASFYGASYIYYPLQEAKGTTDISFKFKTRLSDALLLLAAGRTDYCMIRLEGGRLKLRINLGAGESEMSSPKGILLNDSKWHYFSVVRRDANLTMKIDEDILKRRLSEKFFELNIQSGVYLGSQGNFSELFLGHMENLRGCMEDVHYNGVNIVEKARSRTGQVTVVGITWNCAPEFDAGYNSEISFVDEGSFLILPKINSRAGGRWQIELKTISRDCVVLYNGGGGRGSDFLSVEILDGTIRVKMARGQIIHTVRVDDGHWHKLHLLFNPSLIELSVDGVAMSTRVESSGTRYLDLSESFYIGGIEEDKRQRAVLKGIKAADAGIMGCIRNMEVDDKPLGLPSAIVTKGVLPNCVWAYPCQATPANPPCVPHATCTQHSVDHFTCSCDSALCINPDYAKKYKVFSKLASQLELVALSPLIVQEGGVALITMKNIDVILDYQKYGVKPSGILLHVIQSPQHGRIAVDLALQRVPSQSAYTTDTERRIKQTFTLLDIIRDKVRYVHDGSENHQDRLVLEMELVPEGRFTLPNYLQGKNAFVLHINVTPVNDAPVLNIPPGKVLRLTQGTRKVITSEILKAEDPDTSPVDLLYSVLHGKNEPISGHIEMSGQPVDSFTQQDVDAGLISYVHVTGNDKNSNKTSARLLLQVSDGIETSGPASLRIAIIPLQVRLVNNTGITLVHKSYAIITPDNLTFTTNSDDTTVEVKYDIIKPPQFGAVERLRILDGTWQTVDSFTSQMVAFGRIRYIHLGGQPIHDEFKFKASVGDVRTNTLYDFRLTFIRLELYQTINRELVLNNTREAFINSSNIKFETRPLSISDERIQYTLIRPPKYGMLHVSNGKHHLQAHDTFTQRHVDNDQFWYRLHRRAYSHVQDEFYFVVSASECENVTGTLSIRHVPAPPSSDRQPPHVHTTLERLQVNEGSRMAIPSTHLNFKTDYSVTNLVYNITHMPRHGKLEAVDRDQKVVRDNATYFTSDELNADLVYYCHDDSESRHDSFHFMALSAEPEDFQYVGVFHIDIILKNDNSPVRVSDGVFHVVHGGSRLITARSLRYVDADIDTKPSDIIYTTRSVPNGDIYRADNQLVPFTQFTQEDIDKNRVLFKHHGDEYGKVALWISDGLYDSNGVLEIQASPPFIRMMPSNGSIVENGKTVILLSDDLEIDTNMNCMEENVRFEVTIGPTKGMVEVGGAPGATVFTQMDVSAGRVAYKHREIGSLLDEFRFKVTCDGVSGEGTYQIKIFPSSYWEPLKVYTNRPLVVEESTSVVVTKKCLEVMHPQIEASNIIYKVTDGPRYGWLEVIQHPYPTDPENKDDPKPVKVFDQSIINSKRLNYVQSGINQTGDRITFDVTNGIVWLRGIELSIIIVPEFLYLHAKNVTVMEGSKTLLKSNQFQVLTDYYRGKIVEYRVEVAPKFGKLMKEKNPMTKFLLKDLQLDNVEYVHSGSEDDYDSFVLVALTDGNKESVPFTVNVNILGVNDEPPVIKANTGLCVWEGGIFVFTRTELYVVDADTSADNITFTVLDMTGGYVAMKNNTGVADRYFTQGDIDRGQVVFVHTNGTKGKILFNISDSVHVLHKVLFLITTRPVQVKLLRKRNLNVFPLLRKPITQHSLFCACSDPDRDVRYEIHKMPTLGRIVIDTGDGHHQIVKEFTQRDVNNSVVYYEHTHPFADLYANDSFAFDVIAMLAKPLRGLTFHIEISVSSGGLARYVHIPKLEADEGSRIQVKLNLSAVLNYLEMHSDLKRPHIEAKIATPEHGSIEPNYTRYSLTQLQNGTIHYRHDHSDTTHDLIDVYVYLLPDRISLCNLSLPVTIIPINDQQFRLITDSPQISVVQNERHVITKNDLFTDDADTGPDEIVYGVISGPTQGRILMLPDAVSVNTFTQSDINDGRIAYEHSGALQRANFHFRVWDGKFKPVYTLFNIVVQSAVLNISSGAPAYLQQGKNTVPLSREQIYLMTNVDRHKVAYNVTRQPSHGTIYLGDNPTMRFTYNDLDSNAVIYMQNDMTTANDAFEVVASVPYATATPPVEIRIVVQPFMIINALRVDAYDKSRITTAALDATLLAKLTESNPTYSVTQRPRHGKIKKIIRSSGEHRNAREREVSSFTHEDIKSGVIYFVPKKVPDGAAIESDDSFKFILAASIFQPAIGEVKILIRRRPKDGLPGPNDPEYHEGIQFGYSSMTVSYLFIVVGVSVFVLIAIVIAGAVRCHRTASTRKEQNMTEKMHGQGGVITPMPLPRPPDHLMPSPIQGTPSIKRYISSDNSMHTGINTPMPSIGSIPQCKVTPLRVVDAVPIPPGCADVNTRYPYGAADDHTDTEEWSSYDASEVAYPIRATTTNPMLRRNQYWV